MKLFRRPGGGPIVDRPAVAEFWAWWSTVRDDVATAIGDGSVDRFTDDFGRRVAAIHADLQWELTPGHQAKHGLVVSPGGTAELRRPAARWLSGAPAADAVWEYHGGRYGDLAVFDNKLEIGSAMLALSEIRYAYDIDDDARTIHVRCFHPLFIDLPEDVRTQITYLTLDWLIGEDAVEIWLGRIEPATVAPAEARMPADLAGAVAGMRDTWVLMRGQDRDGTPLIATASVPLRSARWPLFDTYVGVALPYRTFNEGQFPVGDSLTALREIEDRLADLIGVDGALVAHETSRGVRRLHFYVDSETDAGARVAPLTAQWTEGRARLTSERDPRWKHVRHLG